MSARSARSGGGRTVGLVVTALAANLLVTFLFPGSHVVAGLGLAGCLIAIAAVQGITTADLGLARSTWSTGLRWGAGAAMLVGAAYSVAYLTSPLRQALPDAGSDLERTALAAVLVVIPLATVLPEEVAFRGLLLTVLRDRQGAPSPTMISSALFGLWHVLPALGGGAVNDAIATAVGGDAAGTAVRVVATVVFTSMAGVVLSELRLRSGSLLAPFLAHWAANGLGIVVALVA